MRSGQGDPCPDSHQGTLEEVCAAATCRLVVGHLGEWLETPDFSVQPPPAAYPPGSLKGDEGRQASAEGTQVLGICTQLTAGMCSVVSREAEIMNLGNSSPGPHHSP